MATIGTTPVSLIPKVELHRHLEGAVRLATAWHWAQRSPALKGIPYEELRARVQFDGFVGYEHFLKKFETLRHLYYDPEAIAQVMREAVEDAARDQIRYIEFRLSPDHFAKQAGFDLEETAKLLFRTGQTAAIANGIQVRYLCTITRNYSAETCERILDIALRYRDQGVVGFDLAGSEYLATGAHVRALLRRAADEGLGVSVHAGEGSDAPKVWEAIDELYANRIAHGVSSIQDPTLLAELRDRDILLEVCPTSNLHTGAVASAGEHPLAQLVRAGIPVAVGTDDPSISRITLSDEYDFALDVAGLTSDEMATLIMNAAHAAFLPATEKAELVATLGAELRV